MVLLQWTVVISCAEEKMGSTAKSMGTRNPQTLVSGEKWNKE